MEVFWRVFGILATIDLLCMLCGMKSVIGWILDKLGL